MRFILPFCLLLPVAQPALSQVKLDGFFIATEICEGFQSKNKGTNPGFALVEPMRAYEMIGINKAGGDFFQVKMPGEPVTEDRWVHAGCGLHVVAAGTATPAPPPEPPAVTPEPGGESADNLLALSWQPAFCETGAGRPKAECQVLNDGDLPHAAAQFSVHGLWPQPRGNVFCGVPDSLKRLDDARRWGELPALDLTADTREALEVAMPGAASFLHRHEWIKHGTCHKAGGAEGYYLDTLAVTNAINDSAIGDFLEAHVGTEVEMAEIRLLFDQVFGGNAGDAVQFHCRNDGNRFLLQEIRVAMVGVIDHADPDSFGALMQAAERQPQGCDAAVIDPAGLQ
ncbi:Ribonuclease I precursor [Candidatus Rhodobacter oscarellae]|uniref:Ribonuclease I n=1 Tax=Candidatus Rhodobacter oscarellae TaxID=1675527 RepID=A0A0J9EBL9_9RHOB|nr:hypothetical protein [Candidatus Rhodobacter lobularis]KMW60147.1 Ribonuclease I precursor [Candidatus Rhodobacter lobularis]